MTPLIEPKNQNRNVQNRVVNTLIKQHTVESVMTGLNEVSGPISSRVDTHSGRRISSFGDAIIKGLRNGWTIWRLIKWKKLAGVVG